MSWKKHFRLVNQSDLPAVSAKGLGSTEAPSAGTSGKYSSFLPEIYAGHPNRVQRYYQYDDMDRDSDINAALDTIADFCTQSEEQSDQPFLVHYNDGTANETEVTILKEALARWTKLQDFRARLWTVFRNTIKNGDAFFLRDPETAEWLWVDHFMVEGVKVDEERGKTPEEYMIRGLDYNRQAKFGTKVVDPSQYRTPYGQLNSLGARPMAAAASSGANVFTLPGANRDPRTQRMLQQGMNEVHVIDAQHIVHLSLSSGMNPEWPFGQSVLEPVFKTFKQKELLEDSIIIYRVQRAPERRIFYIDVGAMPPARAKAHIEAIKNEIHQRRIPNRTGGGTSILDAAYNPLSIVEDYFFAQGAEGRGSKVETLPGGDQTGEITDLTFFTKKMFRALRVPPSYMSYGDDENSGATYNDGKLGAALIQEFRFNKYCMRLQALLAPVFDREFKRFLRDSGIEVDESLFEIKFHPPQNFGKYREIEVDTARVGLYSQIADNRYLANRFKLKKYLGLTEEELIENETLWREENASKLKKAVGSTPAETEPEGDLGSVGVRPPPDFGMGLPGDEPPPGDEPAPEDGGAPAGPEDGGAPGGSAGNLSPISGGAGGAGGPAGGAPPNPVTVKA